MEAKAAADIFRVCKENNVALSLRYERLLKLLEVKEVAVSMFIRLFEVETLFEGEIKEFFKKK